METQVNSVKQKLQVSYPGKLFTFRDLENMNLSISPQILRVRLKDAVFTGLVQKVDKVTKSGKRGRAELVYSLVTQ